VAVACLLLGVAIANRTRLLALGRHQGPRPGHSWRWIALHLGTYLVALISIWTLTNNDPIKTRFVAPGYPLALILGAGFLSALTRVEPRGRVRTCLGLLLPALLALQAAKTAENWGRNAARTEGGFAYALPSSRDR
jgi:hypothetical protein